MCSLNLLFQRNVISDFVNSACETAAQQDTVVYYYCSSSTVVICEPNPRFMVYLGARFCADKSDLLFAFIQ